MIYIINKYFCIYIFNIFIITKKYYNYIMYDYIIYDKFNTNCNNLSMIFIMLTHLLAIPILLKVDTFKRIIIISYIFSDYFFHKHHWYGNKYLLIIHFTLIGFIILYTLYRIIQLASLNNYIGIYLFTLYILNYIILKLNPKYICYLESTIHINQWLGVLYLISELKNKNINF
jgi:hypothetical protein